MKRVLVVDDEPALLLSIKSGFEGNGQIELLTAENGRDALDILDRVRLDLVVTDLRMPVMDGIQLLAVMSESFPEVPHIVMTAFGTPFLDKLLQQSGVLDILEKPFDIEALEQAVGKALAAQEERSRSLSGLSLSSFLQMVAMEEKTMHIKVFHPSGRSGSLFFRQGELIDAEADQLTGDAAALEMLAWEDIRVSMKEFPAPAPGTRMQSELLPLLFMAAGREDERGGGDGGGSPLEAARLELARLGAGDERITAPNNILTGGEMSIKELLKKMAEEMDGVLTIQVTGMDGITLALHNPTGADVEAFSAKFAMVMKLVEKSVDSLKGLGELEENLVQAKNAWILTRLITPQYYIGIAVNREGTLGNVRLVGQKYIEQLRRLLIKPE